MSKPFLRLRVPLGFLFAGWYFYIAHPNSPSLYWSSFAVVLLGVALRAWAAGYLLKGKRVAVGGPYAFMRNPLYVGSFLLGAGFCLALWQWPLPWTSLLLISVFIFGFGLVYRAKTLAEEKELADSLGEPYLRYAERVPPFLPWRGRVPNLGEQHFSWELYRRNREYRCLLGSVALLVYLYAKTYGL